MRVRGDRYTYMSNRWFQVRSGCVSVVDIGKVMAPPISLQVSRAMLREIELGRSVPSITVLSRIAVAFDVPVSVFLASESGLRVHVMRRGEAEELSSADGKYGSRALFPFLGERRTEFYELRLAPACAQESAAHATGTAGKPGGGAELLDPRSRRRQV
jgi:transcriptional regulator with XRE-family HTH domain